MEANNFSPAAGYLQCEFPGKIIHKIFDDARLLVRGKQQEEGKYFFEEKKTRASSPSVSQGSTSVRGWVGYLIFTPYGVFHTKPRFWG